ncbi:IS66 family insertion sequence element accessory protein TnpB [Sinorhizobium meliloti]|uniref:IS66 family insertion sequence element accessory protein TnpB n=1 Tax=Rhizobium meliloti TaxID=382 RepID=UPI00237F6546|nr:IS66 family insertion sequence element accessory protein TnpB [Sinorhizobium meliloti]
MRKGVEGLAALAQDVLRQKPTGGAVFAFRGRRGDRLKLLYFDGQGFCLYYKILERGRFPWPSAADGTARLTTAQLAIFGKGLIGDGPTGALRRRVSVDFISLNLLVFMDTRPDLW